MRKTRTSGFEGHHQLEELTIVDKNINLITQSSLQHLGS